jgi:peptidoglycan hydrolase-like protein with peptidoglycan-binding domain
MNLRTKSASVVAAIAVGALMFAPIASAASLTDLQIQNIVNLVASFGADSATVARVQAALSGTATPGSSGTVSANGNAWGNGSVTPSCPVFRHTLTSGSDDSTTGGEVSMLQNSLIARGLLNASATGHFGPLTAQAVAKLQTQNGVSALGIVGPSTRALFAHLCSMSGSVGISGSVSGSGSASSDSAMAGIDAQFSALDNDLGTADSSGSDNDLDQ